MRVNVKVVETIPELEKRLRKALDDSLNMATTRAAKPIENKIRSLIRTALEATPEYLSLSSGKLKHEFGLPDGANKIRNIVDIWVNNITVTPKTVKLSRGTTKNMLEISAVRSDYGDVLSAPEATQVTEKGAMLPWLNWLLLQGDRIIIRDYIVAPGPGRAGELVMRATERGRWRVPPEFAGTARNNFVTRAIDSVSSKFTKIIEREIVRHLK